VRSARLPRLPDDLVGGGQQRFLGGEAERLGGLEIDDEFGPRGLLDRQVRWFFALQDAIDVARCAPERIDRIRPVGDQAAAGNEFASTCST